MGVKPSDVLEDVGIAAAAAGGSAFVLAHPMLLGIFALVAGISFALSHALSRQGR